MILPKVHFRSHLRDHHDLRDCLMSESDADKIVDAVILNVRAKDERLGEILRSIDSQSTRR